MRPTGSEGPDRGRALSPAVALGAALAGFLLMRTVGLALGAVLGLRPGLVASEALLLLPTLLALVLSSRSPAASLALRWPGGRGAALSAGAGLALWAASLGLLELQSALWPPPAAYLEMFRALHRLLRPHGPVDALLSVAAIAVVPAACEEAVFRGALLPALRGRLGDAGAVVGSALLFGAIHLDVMPDLTPVVFRVPFAIAVGLGFGWLRLVSNSLTVPLVAHAVLNTVTLAVTPWLDAGTDSPVARPGLGAALLVAGTAASFLAIRSCRDRAGRAPGR